MTTHHNSSLHLNAPVSVGTPIALLVNAVTTWAQNSKNRHEYEQLLQKSDAQLKDVGIDRSWLKTESRKGFWQR